MDFCKIGPWYHLFCFSTLPSQILFYLPMIYLTLSDWVMNVLDHTQKDLRGEKFYWAGESKDNQDCPTDYEANDWKTDNGMGGKQLLKALEFQKLTSIRCVN